MSQQLDHRVGTEKAIGLIRRYGESTVQKKKQQLQPALRLRSRIRMLEPVVLATVQLPAVTANRLAARTRKGQTRGRNRYEQWTGNAVHNLKIHFMAHV